MAENKKSPNRNNSSNSISFICSSDYSDYRWNYPTFCTRVRSCGDTSSYFWCNKTCFNGTLEGKKIYCKVSV